jgi:hypothetical protein
VFVCVNLANLARWRADDDNAITHVAINNAVRPDDRAAANRDSWQHDNIGPEPGSSSDADRAWSRDVLTVDRHVGQIEAVDMVQDVNVACDQDVRLKDDRQSGADDEEAGDATSIADLDDAVAKGL